MIKNIYWVLAFLPLFSCSGLVSGPDEEPETRGVMQVEILDQSAFGVDKLETVRFLVFKDASVSPRLELNELYQIPAADPGGEVSRFGITLQVSRRSLGRNDKMVVAIINEPAALTPSLEALSGYEQLRDMELDLTNILNPDHTALRDGALMPMTGIKWTDKVYASESEAEADPAAMEVRRALARVDVYMKKEAGMDFSLASGTGVILTNTYDRQYLVRHEDGSNVFGLISTVTSGFLSRNWLLSDSDIKDLPEASDNERGRLVCSFYTAERTCSAAANADKLLLDMDVVTSEGATRSGRVAVDQFVLEGTVQNIEMVERNNNYKVLVTVGPNDITASVLDWNKEEVEIDF